MTEPKTAIRRIPSLDGLRGLSIWAVMLAHLSGHYRAGLLGGHLVHTFLANSSYFGVTVFFVISGFLITMLLLKERARTAHVSLSRFYRRRAVRILPASLFYILVVVLLAHPTRAQIVYAFTFTTSFFYANAYKPLQQLWSLSVEEQFYLIWPLLFLRGVRTARITAWIVMICCPLLRLGLKHYGYTEYAHLAPAIDDSLAAGCLMALYQENVRSFARRYLVSTVRFLSLCLVTIAMAMLLYNRDVVLLWGIVPGLTVLVLCAAIEREDYLLNKGPLVWSGLLSYSLYLWQQPLLVFDGPLNYASLRLIFTFIAALLSYWLIEKPVLHFFNQRLRPPAKIPAIPSTAAQ